MLWYTKCFFLLCLLYKIATPNFNQILIYYENVKNDYASFWFNANEL